MSAVGDGADPASPSTSDATRTGQLTQADLAPGTMLAGRFRIEGLLGIGGMGVVYRATDIALGVPVAIKVLRPEIAVRPDAFERFRNELLLARQVSSPHVLRIHDIARDGERWLISMDLVEGRPLDRLLDERGPLPVDEALAIARQVALGLGAAHAQGVVHRDLKPSNVLVGAEGRAWVGDFGIARSLGDSGGLTRTGQVIGTPDYLSPEQARAEPVDARSDLYALGLLLFEMLSGRLPFAGGTPAEALTQRMVATPPPIRSVRADVPAWVERLLERLLQARPSRRFPDAEAVVRAIDERKVARDLRPGRWGWLAAAALLALVVGAVAWRGWPPQAALAPAAPVPVRLAVLPIENATGDATLAPALAGASEWLRWQFADRAMPVVDGERVDQGMAQLALADAAPSTSDARSVRGVLPASHQLRVRLERDASGFVARVRLVDADGQVQSWNERGGDAIAPLEAAVAKVRPALEPQSTGAAPDAPSIDALSGFGEGLALLRRGRMAQSWEVLAKLPAAGNDFAVAALARAQAAHAAGRRDDALAATDGGLKLADGTALPARLRYWRALAGEGLDAALAAELAATRARPDDLDAALRLAQLQAQSGDLPAASATLEASLARDASDPRAWYFLGRFSIMRGELRPAVDEQLVRALVLYKRGRNAWGEAETVNALGVGYSRLGQVTEAQEHYAQAVARRRALGDARGVASSLRNLAQLATTQGQFAQAQAQYEEARTLFAQVGDEAGLNAVDNELGLLAEERGDFVAADAAYRRMLRASEAAGDDIGRAESLNNIGYAQYQLGDYDAAQVFWRQAAGVFAAQEDMNGQVRAEQNLGLLEAARGNWSSARKLLESSLATAQRQQMAEEAAVSRRNLAELALMQGQVDAAVPHLDAAAALFAERGDLRGEIDVALLRIRKALLAGAIDEARTGLEALAPKLAEASAEQGAIAALLRARLARTGGDRGGEAAALAQAKARAEASGVARWKLEAALLGGGIPDAALREQVDRLGHATLQVELAAHAMRAALAANQASIAADEYRRTLPLLERLGDVGDAAIVHALGAQALARGGEGDAAAQAEAKARAATIVAAGKDADDGR